MPCQYYITPMTSSTLYAATLLLLLSAAACSKPPASSTSGSASRSALPTPAEPSSALHAAPSTAPSSSAASPSALPPADVLPTASGDLTIQPVYHATLWFRFGGKVIVLDPWSKAGDRLDGAPKADWIVLTDMHPDHLDMAAIDRFRKDSTRIIGPAVVSGKVPGVIVMSNGDRRDEGLFSLEAIPMYNLTRGPAPGKLYHDKGRGNGYVFTFANRRVYVSGDTECTPEMRALRNIDVAFVCMNLPYTMTPAEAAECIRQLHPRVVYPYHDRDADLAPLTSALSGTDIEARLRSWY